MVATKRGPFLSTNDPPKTAEVPTTAIRIIKAACVPVSDHPWAAINGFLKTDHAYTVPRHSCMTTAAPAINHLFVSKF